MKNNDFEEKDVIVNNSDIDRVRKIIEKHIDLIDYSCDLIDNHIYPVDKLDYFLDNDLIIVNDLIVEKDVVIQENENVKEI